MKTRDFSFDLPRELIAQHPADRRQESRLLTLGRTSGTVGHHTMTELPQLIPPGTLMVLNDSRVRKARLYGQNPRGAEQEFLFVRAADDGRVGNTWEVMTRKARRLNDGDVIVLPGDVRAVVVGRDPEHLILRTEVRLEEQYFDEYGHVPLPPYIRRDDTESDSDRYQTVYADKPGSVAAPTAGLHFTPELLAAVQERGVTIARVTLHVGPGTFLPVRTEEIDTHRMHSEYYEVSEDAAERINTAMSEGRPVLAVGTTSVRTLESAVDPSSGRVSAGSASTDIFIRPGYRFRVVTGLLTNFHTPESTLLMLVAAFATREFVLDAYRKAVEMRYRFFSYGDAMLIQ